MRIAGYNCISEISRGPLTSVYLCQQKAHSVPRLIKILHPQHQDDQEIIKRFSREAKLYARLDHPNIVKVIDLGQFNRQYYIVLEYISGWPLDKFLKKTGAVPAGVSVEIIRQVLAGLKYAHGQGIIHRDIKPSNLLVAQDGQVKIADFGLARQNDVSAITEQGNIIGTPAYMSPEVLRGEKSSAASDIFSLGITWYELLTQENPFSGESIPESINHILNTNPPSLIETKRDIPAWLDHLIHRMLLKDTNERPGDCAEIIDTIDVHDSRVGDAIYSQNLTRFIKEQNISPLNHGKESSMHKINKRFFKRVAGIALLFLLLTAVYVTYFIPNVDVAKVQNMVPSAIDTLDIEFEKPRASDKTSALSAGQNTLYDTTPVITENMDINAGQSEVADTMPGAVYIAVTPWAEVHINRQYYGTTPLFQDITLPPGTHHLELRNPSFRIYQTELNITPGLTDTFRIQLENLYGSLLVKVNPWGEIYLDDEYIDTTPLKNPIKLRSGRYDLAIRNPYFKTHQERIEIQSGITREITINLTK